jgi:hypothetical protein
VQQTSGFAPGLFSGQELDAHAIQVTYYSTNQLEPHFSTVTIYNTMQDKDGKIAYLTKIIAVVSLALDQPVPAKPSKVSHTQSYWAQA